MSTSRIPAIVEAVVTVVTTAVGSSAQVFDGAWSTVPDGDYVAVGWTPDDQFASSAQTWAAQGNRSRDEAITVPCYIDSYSGDTDVAARRTVAFNLLGLIETAVRADPTLGGAVPRSLPAEITEIRERHEQTDKGLAFGVTFLIHVPRARI